MLTATGIVAIVGTRDASKEGMLAAYGLAREFVFHNIVVLSGLADGIDKQAHLGAVHYYGQTIGILGHGFDATYTTKDSHLWNEIVAREGAVITEYLPNESASKENFLRRNELQAALSNLVVPIETPDLASGTGATIRRAISLKTPLLGIGLDQGQNSTLKKTVENLKSLKIPIYSLPSEREELWHYVLATMPNYRRNSDPRDRQRRFANILLNDSMLIIDNFVQELKRASFSEQDIDWLANEIKKKLG